RARALAHFEALAASIDDASVRLELAKLYEHWAKEPERALEWVVQGTGEPPAQAQKRAERLAKKLTRVRQGSLALTPTRSTK
ncbi:MAG: hypothetical protein M3O36_10425, partial [Myxococcota bacterium]|nr:hypothetical protein [Myxococcota bacterium]